MKRWIMILFNVLCLMFAIDFVGGRMVEEEVTVVSATLHKDKGTLIVWWNEGSNPSDWGNNYAYIDPHRWNEVKIGEKLTVKRRVGLISRYRYLYIW